MTPSSVTAKRGLTVKNCFLVACCFLWPGGATVAETHGPQIDVLRYTLALRPDIQTGAVAGVETVEFKAMDRVTQLRFSANALNIDRVTIDGKPADFTMTPQDLAISLPASLSTRRALTLRIVFAGKPKRGLVSQPAAIYSSYFACDWMFCLQDTPGDKALFDLDLHLPNGDSSVAGGRRLSDQRQADGMTIHRWRAQRPYSPYLFGFVAGTLSLSQRRQGPTQFSYINATGNEADLDRMFAETSAAAAFFAEKSGIPLPGGQYAQVLVEGQEAQEAAGFSLIGRDVLERDLREPDTQWVIAHEMAHQWWGNLVTCETWQDFWLNEGFATFMTAAWKQRRFGEAAYQADLDVARTRLKSAADLGYDKPLTWDGKYPSLKTRRAVHYSKGALFLDRLRSEIGDRAFWSGLRAYTQKFAGRTVRSIDFERAMTQASGRDLSGLFAQWVYAAPGKDR